MFVLSGTVSFVGSHLDVVPANPETWERNPFKLCVEVGVICVLGKLSDTSLDLCTEVFRLVEGMCRVANHSCVPN